MISLCLQCCPLDLGATFELTKLICDIEDKRKENGEFFLIYRQDCPLWVPQEFEKLAGRRFERVAARQARNHDTGWPGGSNMLAFSAFMEMDIMRYTGTFKNEAFLLFEPDCVPLATDWIDQLSMAWEEAKSAGKEATGHWHQQGDESTLHMNGNAIFIADFQSRHPDILNGPATQGWDYWYRAKITPISCDTYAIYQLYNRASITPEELQGVTKHGRRPALLHGIKDSSARQSVLEMLASSNSLKINENS